VTPEPGAYVFLDDERLKIHSARQAPHVTTTPGLIISRDKKLYLGCVGGSLELLTVQPAGKQSMNAMDWFRGLHREEVTVS
jgi:methionyl-tRNA formyltransferase